MKNSSNSIQLNSVIHLLCNGILFVVVEAHQPPQKFKTQKKYEELKSF